MRKFSSPLLVLSLFLILVSCTSPTPAWLTSPVPESPPVNQLRTHGNACGPACLLDSFRSGSPKWQESLDQLDGTSDNEKLTSLIRTVGKRPSHLNPQKPRWNPRTGLNGLDLTAIANELRASSTMPTVSQQSLFPNSRQSPTALLQFTHQKLRSSLQKGLPPILSVRRLAFQKPPGSAQPAWLTLKGHYLVLTGLPGHLPKDATSFPVTYHDPWGGKKLQGTIRISDPENPLFNSLATLVADFPDTKVGLNQVPAKRPQILSLTSAIGLF